MAVRCGAIPIAASLSASARCLVRTGCRLSTTDSRDFCTSVENGEPANAAAAAVVVVVEEGQKFEVERQFTAEDVASYVQLSGDTNPIHTSDLAAQAAGFQRPVVQGMLYAGLFPAIIGSHFDGAVYVSQTLNFKAPVLVGDSVCAEVEVTAVKKLRHHYRVTFATQCYKKGDPTLLLGGEAVALLPA